MPEPEVGIFYLLNDEEIVVDSTPLDHAENRGGDFLIHSRDHQSFWEEEVVRRHDGLRFHSYDYSPRGRVVYRIKDGTFTLYKDKCVVSKWVDEVVRKLNLPPEKTTICSDPHYKCRFCNRRYVSDSVGLDY